MQIKRFIFGVAAVGIGFVVPAAASAALTIDTFEVGEANVVVTQGTGPTTFVETGLSTSHVLGGSRSVTVDYLSGPGDVSEVSAKSMIINGDGVLALSSDTGVVGQWNLLYNENGDGFNAGLGRDLSESGANTGFAVFFMSADAGAETLVTLTDVNSNTLTRSASTTGAGTLFFDYADFTGLGNIAEIVSIEFQVTGLASGDYIIQLIESNDPGAIDDTDGGNDTGAGDDTRAVPEPATAGLAVLSLTGLAAAALRRRR